MENINLELSPVKTKLKLNKNISTLKWIFSINK